MKRFYLDSKAVATKKIEGELYNYIKNVLRLHENDEFIGFSNDDYEHTCKITKIEKNEIEFEYTLRHYNTHNPRIKIDLFQALVKGDKLDLIAQKATELGADSLYLIHTQYCDVTKNSTRPNRLEKIVINACQQCGRSKLMNIYGPEELADMVPTLKCYDLILFANTNEQQSRILPILAKHKKSTRIACVVGPEGGFSNSEILLLEQHASSVTLGERILRTETAGLYMLSILNAFYEV